MKGRRILSWLGAAWLLLIKLPEPGDTKSNKQIKWNEHICLVTVAFRRQEFGQRENNLGSGAGHWSMWGGRAEPAAAAGGVESGRRERPLLGMATCSLCCPVSFARYSKLKKKESRNLFLVANWFRNLRLVNTNSVLCLKWWRFSGFAVNGHMIL